MVSAAFLSLLVYSLTTHSILGTVDGFVAPLSNGTFVALIFCLGAVQLVTALLANYILSKISASKMSVFANLSTVVSIASGAIFLQETITWYHLFGSALIIAGVIGSNVSVKMFRSQPLQQPQQLNEVK
jgi:drug/metabolite transporter (DMT)-like permease